jgi:hypothetical protein
MAKIFISYSHEDEVWKDRLVRHLEALAGAGLETWDDRKIAAGFSWKNAIGEAIANCDAALLLVSKDFLNSDFILKNEVLPLLQRREREGVRVIPLILSPCTWNLIPWVQSIQVHPRDGKPLSGMSKSDAEAALSALAAEIADLVLTPPSKSSFLPPPGATKPSAALAIWKEKLEFLHLQEAIISDPAQKFTIKKQIEEAEAKIREWS